MYIYVFRCLRVKVGVKNLQKYPKQGSLEFSSFMATFGPEIVLIKCIFSDNLSFIYP